MPLARTKSQLKPSSKKKRTKPKSRSAESTYFDYKRTSHNHDQVCHLTSQYVGSLAMSKPLRIETSFAARHHKPSTEETHGYTYFHVRLVQIEASKKHGRCARPCCLVTRCNPVPFQKETSCHWILSINSLGCRKEESHAFAMISQQERKLQRNSSRDESTTLTRFDNFTHASHKFPFVHSVLARSTQKRSIVQRSLLQCRYWNGLASKLLLY